MLISIDTSAGTSVAIFRDSQLLAAASFDDPFGHAENIGKAIASALADAQVSTAELTAVAVGRGPAPYTGLRVGVAAAQLLARSLGLPLHGVMVLDAIAHGSSGKVLVRTDAKRRELFVARYQDGIRQSGPEVVSPENLDTNGYALLSGPADAVSVGKFALAQLELGADLSDSSAIYLRSPDVSPSKGKRVSG